MAFYLPLFEHLINYDDVTRANERTYSHIEERTHLLATLLSLYPFTDTKALAEEFQMAEKEILRVAHYNGIHKTSAERSAINKANGRDIFLRLLHGKYEEKIKGKFNHNKK